jgi:glutamate-1-semialdehyde aminotransferase
MNVSITTGKRVILSCGFHGWQDFALDYFSFADSGIPKGTDRVLYKFGFNHREGFFELYERHKDDLAAVMIEPSGPFTGPETGVAGDVDEVFLREIADAARRVRALLIFDEIITGYRYRQGSVQKATGVVPDLTCLGKALASGMPLSALVGASRYRCCNEAQSQRSSSANSSDTAQSSCYRCGPRIDPLDRLDRDVQLPAKGNRTRSRPESWSRRNRRGGAALTAEGRDTCDEFVSCQDKFALRAIVRS